MGALALDKSVDEVVTWGEPVNSLKVELLHDFAGTDYIVTRGPGGAEVRFGSERITGQKEVTKFYESLFNADRATAKKLMIADQNDIRGALKSGEATKMIEALADIDLVDRLIALLQQEVPNGNSKYVADRLTLITQELEATPQPVLDTAELDAAGASLAAELQGLHDTEATLRERCSQALKALEVVNGRQQRAASLQAVRTQLLQQQQEFENKAGVPVPPKNLQTEEQIHDLWQRASAAAQHRQWAETQQKLQKLSAEFDEESVWEGPAKSLQQAILEAQQTMHRLGQERERVQSERFAALAQVIQETTCGLCGKDLQDVPEVVLRNAQAHERVAAADAALAALQQQHDEAHQARVELQEVQRRGERLDALLAAAGPTLVQRLDTHVPAQWAWIGPQPQLEDGVALEQQAQAAQQLLNAYKLAIARAEEAGESLEKVRSNLQSVQAELNALAAHAAEDAAAIALHKELSDSYSKLGPQILEKQHQIQMNAKQLQHLKETYQWALDARQKLIEQKAKCDKDLAEIAFGDELIRALRAARPVISDQLWKLVLTTVSYHFSDMRGVTSVVTRKDSVFQIDGKDFDNFSGSTQDVLGLAIRAALTRTFLPNMDLMMLDEPAAGCDTERELALLGTISSCGFRQTVLVTHSELADAVADQVIPLGGAA